MRVGKKFKNFLKNGLFFFFASAVLFFLPSCADKKTKAEKIERGQFSAFNESAIENERKNDDSLLKYFENLTLEQKISQLFIENLEGCEKFRSYETVGNLNGGQNQTPLVAGGYIFFSYNIAQTREKQKAFIRSIYDYCDEWNLIYPYLAVDQEGGFVSRLKKLNDDLPSNKTVAKNFTVSQAYSLYEKQAIQMKDLGFHMNLAPVAETETVYNADFLNGRSFGDFQSVLNYASACVSAYENNGVSTVVKHFPGNTNTDPHTGLPEIALSKEDLENSIFSFKEILKYNPTAVLMSHARTSAVDKTTPSCLSKIWTTEILKNEYGYDGLIFSDDIFMAALTDNGYPPEKAAVLAIEAGVDCIMISEKRFANSAKILYEKAKSDSDFLNLIEKASFRVIKYKNKIGLLKI